MGTMRAPSRAWTLKSSVFWRGEDVKVRDDREYTMPKDLTHPAGQAPAGKGHQPAGRGQARLVCAACCTTWRDMETSTPATSSSTVLTSMPGIRAGLHCSLPPLMATLTLCLSCWTREPTAPSSTWRAKPSWTSPGRRAKTRLPPSSLRQSSSGTILTCCPVLCQCCPWLLWSKYLVHLPSSGQLAAVWTPLTSGR